MDYTIATGVTAIGAGDVAPASGAKGEFTSGNPVTAVPATVLPGYQMNAIVQEIINVIVASGQTPSNTNTAQLLAALRALGRIKLITPLNLYVSTAGSDANNGMTSGTPFLTLQKAWNTVIENYDLGGQTVTINVANGTYTAGVACISNPVGAISGINNVPGQTGPAVTFLGNPTTPDSVVINATNNNCFQATNGAQIAVSGFRLTANGTSGLYNQEGVGLYAFAGGGIQFSHIDFGPCSISHINATVSGFIETYGSPYTISGSAPCHVTVSDGSYVTCAGSTVTLTGSPAFSVGFVNAAYIGTAFMGAMTFSGSATGPYYNAGTNGVITTGGAGATYFPGNSAGVVSNGGVYV